MFLLEYKLRGKPKQFQAIDEGIRTVQFVRNKCVRHWMDSLNVGKAGVYKYTTQLRKDFEFVKRLNSTAWSAISKFYEDCKKQIKGKKGYPQFSKRTRSIEYKKSGGKRVKKSLSTRTHICSCGYIEDRDTPASLNILRKATIGHIGSKSELLDLNAWGEHTSTLVGEMLSKQVSLMNQESSHL